MNFKGARKTDVGKSDKDLVKESLRGDQDSFRLLYRRYVPKVRSTLIRLSGPAYLNDQTQDVFLSIWRNLAQVQAVDSIAPWIYRIAVNVAFDSLRSKRKWLFVPLTDDMSNSKDPASITESKQLVELVLNELDFPHRTVLVLHDMEQLTESEIAEALSIPRGTVKSRLHNARSRARSLLYEKGKSL